MSVFHALILGFVQGITELLPISSSGHLVIVESLLHLRVEELKSFDVALHTATLIAIMVYFAKDFRDLLLFKNKSLMKKLVIATIPAIIVGVLLNDQIDAMFRDARWIAVWLIVGGILFLIAESVPHQKLKKEVTSLREAFVIGLGQMCALIPGVSRSGITITMGLFQGIERAAAAKFSFLLGSIAIAAAAFYTAVSGDFNGEGAMVGLSALAAGMAAAFLSSLGAVWFLMQYLRNHSLAIFAYYRFILGAVLVLLTY